MKDVYQIFDESFTMIKQFVEEYRFSNCSTITSELVRIAAASDFKDGIFQSEVLESVFSQITPLFKSYVISDTDMKSFRNELLKQIDLLSKTYRGNDGSKIYPIIRDIRSVATQFQYKCWTTMIEKSEPDIKKYARGA